MTDVRMAVAVSVLARGILEIAGGKGMQLKEHDNLVALASITNRVKQNEIAGQLQDSRFKNVVRETFFDGDAEGI